MNNDDLEKLLGDHVRVGHEFEGSKSYEDQ